MRSIARSHKHRHVQRSTGRLRNRKGLLSGGGKDQDSGSAIMFADVAGVDEAKEELEEIVVIVLTSCSEYSSVICSTEQRFYRSECQHLVLAV